MFAYFRRHRALSLGVLAAASLGVIVLGIVMQGGAARANDSGLSVPQQAAARQAASPTPGFGPIITAPPQQLTPTPGAVIATPTPKHKPTKTPQTPKATKTPRPSKTPGPTRIPSEQEATPTPFVPLTPLPTYRADVMGIQVNPGVSMQQFDTTLWLLGRLGVKWIKLQFAWKLLEPQQGTFSDVLYTYRLLVQRANQQGFKVMISVAKAPDWARATTDEDGPPRNPQDLASFLTRLMGEVRTDMYGNSYFNAIEVWNEPNLRREWNGGTISGAEYMRLFDAAYNGIRAGEGGATVTIITAGLAPTGINDGTTAVDDREYFRQMYAAGLNNPAYQNIVIGVHPYGAANPPDARCCSTADYANDPTWFFMDTLEDYHTIMVQAGDTSRVLWATEFGWGTYEGFVTSAGDPAPPPDVPYFQWITQDQQANYIMRAFEIGQGLPYVGMMILWNLDYSAQAAIDARDAQAAYSLLRGGTDPLRPAFKLIEAAPKQ